LNPVQSFDFPHAPGHLIRRAHQTSIALFSEEMAEFDVTALQFAMLNVLVDEPGIDQITLAQRVFFDAATSGSVIGRLEAKGWIYRQQDEADKRRRLLWLTPEGKKMVQRMSRPAAAVQERLMEPLGSAERKVFLQLLAKLVQERG
jgi:DNA-binding MarR family transcriptional regulator